MATRVNDWVRMGLLATAAIVAAFWPAVSAFAQTQDAINATLTEQIKGVVLRIDKIDSMINAVLIALVINFIAQVVQIRRTPSGRGR